MAPLTLHPGHVLLCAPPTRRSLSSPVPPSHTHIPPDHTREPPSAELRAHRPRAGHTRHALLNLRANLETTASAYAVAAVALVTDFELATTFAPEKAKETQVAAR
jgi:hypothetical protein